MANGPVSILIRVRPAAVKVFDPVVLTRAALERVLRAVGSDVVVGLLRVDRNSVPRWRAGGRIAQPESDRILDLDSLLTRALQVFHADGAGEWLSSPSPFLHGSRPVDALFECGLGPVLTALAAVLEGVFA